MYIQDQEDLKYKALWNSPYAAKDFTMRHEKLRKWLGRKLKNNDDYTKLIHDRKRNVKNMLIYQLNVMIYNLHKTIKGNKFSYSE